MTPSIGNLIADAASSALGGLGNMPDLLVARPPARPAPGPSLGDAPAFDLVLVKISLIFNL